MATTREILERSGYSLKKTLFDNHRLAFAEVWERFPRGQVILYEEDGQITLFRTDKTT